MMLSSPIPNPSPSNTSPKPKQASRNLKGPFETGVDNKIL